MQTAIDQAACIRMKPGADMTVKVWIMAHGANAMRPRIAAFHGTWSRKRSVSQTSAVHSIAVNPRNGASRPNAGYHDGGGSP